MVFPQVLEREPPNSHGCWGYWKRHSSCGFNQLPWADRAYEPATTTFFLKVNLNQLSSGRSPNWGVLHTLETSWNILKPPAPNPGVSSLTCHPRTQWEPFRRRELSWWAATRASHARYQRRYPANSSLKSQASLKPTNTLAFNGIYGHILPTLGILWLLLLRNHQRLVAGDFYPPKSEVQLSFWIFLLTALIIGYSMGGSKPEMSFKWLLHRDSDNAEYIEEYNPPTIIKTQG